MKLFITGATGLIGMPLAIKLAEMGHEVHALYRCPEKKVGMEHPNLYFHKGDILDVQSIERAMDGCQGVFHLAAYAKLWAKDPATYFKINVEGTQNVLTAAKKLNVRRFILTSSVAVFGPSSEEKITEETKRSLPFFNEYERTKVMAEKIVMDASDESFEVIIVNPTRVYGPGLLSESNGVTRLTKLYMDRKLRIIPGNGKSIGNYAYIDDVVNGHILAFDNGKPGETYLLGGENVTFDEFFETLGKATARHIQMVHLPLFILSIIAFIFELGANLLGRPPFITRKWVKRYLYNWEVSSQKAIDELGYQITPLFQGLKRTTLWLEKAFDR